MLIRLGVAESESLLSFTLPSAHLRKGPTLSGYRPKGMVESLVYFREVLEEHRALLNALRKECTKSE